MIKSKVKKLDGELVAVVSLVVVPRIGEYMEVINGKYGYECEVIDVKHYIDNRQRIEIIVSFI